MLTTKEKANQFVQFYFWRLNKCEVSLYKTVCSVVSCLISFAYAASWSNLLIRSVKCSLWVLRMDSSLSLTRR